MITREALLKKSIQEFQDNVNNTLVYRTENIITPSGFMYILKLPNPKQISCAIHFNRSWDSDIDLGKIETYDYEISSREYIEPESIIEYEGIDIAYLSYSSFNETMKQYTYSAISTFGYNNKYIIYDKNQIETNLNINCFPYIYGFLTKITQDTLSIPVYPSYFNVSRAVTQGDYKFISIDVSNTKCINVLASDYNKIDGTLVKSLRQNNNDDVRLAFVNMNQVETYTILDKLQEYLTNSKDIGLIDTINTYQNDVYQKSFNIKSVTHISEFRVNYNLTITPDQPVVKAIDLTQLLAPLITSEVLSIDDKKNINNSGIHMLNKV